MKIGALGRERWDHAVTANPEQMQRKEDGNGQRQKHNVPTGHVVQVHRVEEGPDTDGVERVLGLLADVLAVVVALQDVAGQFGEDSGQKRQRAEHPGESPAASPGGGEERGAEVHERAEEEDLHRPEVQ